VQKTRQLGGYQTKGGLSDGVAGDKPVRADRVVFEIETCAAQASWLRLQTPALSRVRNSGHLILAIRERVRPGSKCRRWRSTTHQRIRLAGVRPGE